MPGREYYDIGPGFGAMFDSVRVSLGDFSIFSGSAYLNFEDNIIF